MAGGEASQLTRLPEDVGEICLEPGRPPAVCRVGRDHRAIPCVGGGIRTRPRHVTLGSSTGSSTSSTGWASRIRSRPTCGSWMSRTAAPGASHRASHGTSSPPGAPMASGSPSSRIGIRRRDLTWRADVYLIDAEGGPVTRVTGGRGDRTFGQPTWSPDGSLIAATGHRFPAGNASPNSLWLFPPEAEQAGRDLTAESGREIGAGINSDLAGVTDPGLTWSADGGWLVFAAPIDGSYQLWRAASRRRPCRPADQRRTRRHPAPRRGARHGPATGHGRR